MGGPYTLEISNESGSTSVPFNVRILGTLYSITSQMFMFADKGNHLLTESWKFDLFLIEIVSTLILLGTQFD